MLVNKRRMVIENKEVMKLWDYDRNLEIGLDPSRISEGSGRKAYFVCDNGHIKFKTINKEIDGELYCLECNSLYFKHPDVMKYWDWEENGRDGIDPKTVRPNSNKKAHFICEEGHRYSRFISSAVKGHSCRMCNSLGYVYPEIFEIWSSKNKKTPYEYGYGTSAKAWLKCAKNHSHKERYSHISNRVKDGEIKDCAICNGYKLIVTDDNSFGSVHPDKVKLWSEKNKKTPFEYTYGSKKKVYWKCMADLGHPDYLQEINHKKAGYGCPLCRNIEIGIRNKIPKKGSSFGDLYKDAVSMWSEKNVKTPFEYKPNSGHKVWFKCLGDSSHPDYLQAIVKKYSDGSGCPSCGGGRVSRPNRIFYERYKHLSPVLERRMKVDDESFHLDVLIEEKEAVIEFDGLYWHRDIVDTDIRRTKKLLGEGYRVIRVRESGLESLNIDNPRYHEISVDTNGYQYKLKLTRDSIQRTINSIDEILEVNPLKRREIEEIIDYVL